MGVLGTVGVGRAGGNETLGGQLGGHGGFRQSRGKTRGPSVCDQDGGTIMSPCVFLKEVGKEGGQAGPHIMNFGEEAGVLAGPL